MSKKKVSNRATHAVEFCAETDGVEKLCPWDFHSFVFSVRCTQCGAIRENVHIENEEHEVEGSRGLASFVMNCKDCSRTCKISYVSENFDTKFEDYSDFNKLFTLDCRGCTIDKVDCHGWTVTSESGETHDWQAEDDFFEYDEELGRPVTVTNVQFQITPIK